MIRRSKISRSSKRELFFDNDLEVIDGEWLSAMAEHIQRPEVGAVGARLLWPNDTVEHAGIVLGVGGIAEHAFRGFPAEDPRVFKQLQVTRNYSCVTGACLLTRRDVFIEVGGFDEEHLAMAFNDVDLCLKMRRAGYLIVYTPFAKLYRHESAGSPMPSEPNDGPNCCSAIRITIQISLANAPIFRWATELLLRSS